MVRQTVWENGINPAKPEKPFVATEKGLEPQAVNYFADITRAWIVMLVYQIMFHCSIIDPCSSHNAPLPLMITAYKNINILFLSLLSLHVQG